MASTLPRPSRWSARTVALTVLFAAVLLLPRIPLDMAMPGRRLDLRIEDCLLVIFSLAWFTSLLQAGARLHVTPAFRWLALYVGLAIASSCVGVVTLRVHALKSLLYLSKELEYFLLFLLVANWVRTDEDLRRCTKCILGLGALNAMWVAVQVVTGQKQTLLSGERGLPAGVYERLSESYGPHLIGEASPLATGGVFMLLLVLCFCLATVESRRALRHMLLAAAFAFLVCLLLSFSRTSVVAALVGGVVLLACRSRRFTPRIGSLVVLTLCGAALLLDTVSFLSEKLNADMGHRLREEAVESGVAERRDDIWQPLLERALERPLIGHGKAAIGSVTGLGEGEAHNHYLRVFAEMGLLGLAAFLRLLWALGAISRKTMLRSSIPEGRAMGAAMLASTMGLAVGALFQDVFVPVILNELWWALLGLTAAAYRLDTRTAARNAQQRGSRLPWPGPALAPGAGASPVCGAFVPRCGRARRAPRGHDRLNAAQGEVRGAC